MLPLDHAAFAYLCFVGVAAVTDRTLPARRDLVPLLFASQFPDLVDKPLAYVGLLASGRSLAHSLVVLLVIVVVAGPLSRRAARVVETERLRSLLAAAPLPFVVGHISHLVGDLYRPVLSGTFQDTVFLFWPLLRIPAAPVDRISPWTRIVEAYAAGGLNNHIALVGGAALLFLFIRIWAHWRRQFGATRPR